MARLSKTALAVDKMSNVIIEAMLAPPRSSSDNGKDRDVQISLAAIAVHTMDQNSNSRLMSERSIYSNDASYMELGAFSSGDNTVQLSGSSSSEVAAATDGSASHGVNVSRIEPALTDDDNDAAPAQFQLKAVDAKTLAATLSSLQIAASDLVPDQKAAIGAGGFAKVWLMTMFILRLTLMNQRAC